MVKLFVGNLNPQSKAADLRKKFEVYGKVTECDIVNNYGFVHMEKDADAEAAMKNVQGTILDGVKINVERSHGKRAGGPGPMRRRFRDGPPDRMRGPPTRFMGPGQGTMPPRMGRYGPGWEEGYGSPYGPPPNRNPRGGPPFDYPTNGGPGRYPSMERGDTIPSRTSGREPLPPPPGPAYRGPPGSDGARDYPAKGPARPSRYENYDNYEYDRYRDSSQQPPRSGEHYDYGNYSSGYDEMREGDRPTAGGYGSSYDYGYYDYGADNRTPPPRYSYGRP